MSSIGLQALRWSPLYKVAVDLKDIIKMVRLSHSETDSGPVAITSRGLPKIWYCFSTYSRLAEVKRSYRCHCEMAMIIFQTGRPSVMHAKYYFTRV